MEIDKATGYIDDKDVKEQTLNLKSELIVTPEQQEKINAFHKAYNELPIVEMKLSHDGGKTWGAETLKLDLKGFYSNGLDEDNKNRV